MAKQKVAVAPDYRHVLDTATKHLISFIGHTLDVVDVARPTDLEYAVHLSKVISKLSPMLGNTIEYRVVAELNKRDDWPAGKWLRQDPGFPDTIFAGEVTPIPGIEIKTWFPLATEITARFKDSITHFPQNQTSVAMIAWVPDGIIFGKPKIVDVWVDSAQSVAKARDLHYHHPPDYLVFEPEDTAKRTRNLQQTNTAGYKFQGTMRQREMAEEVVASWGRSGRKFSHTQKYQQKLRSLLGQFPYRLDTNFSKMDRIEHPTLEEFKARVLATEIRGHSILGWKKILKRIVQPKNVTILEQLIAN